MLCTVLLLIMIHRCSVYSTTRSELLIQCGICVLIVYLLSTWQRNRKCIGLSVEVYLNLTQTLHTS